MAEETILLQDNNVLISNIRFVFSDKVFTVANVSTVTPGVIPPKRQFGIFLSIIGVLLSCCCISLSVGSIISGDSSFPDIYQELLAIGLTIVFILLGIGMLVAGILIAKRAAPTYVIKVGSTAGETVAFSSKDRSYIDKIIDAMNKAIIHPNT